MQNCVSLENRSEKADRDLWPGFRNELHPSEGGIPVRAKSVSKQNEKSVIQKLQKAYRKSNLTLYLGAGVSVANGIPSWDKLVLAMYFSAIKSKGIDEALRPFPNYLFAIAEWHLERRREPLDITARKIRNLYRDEDLFLDKLQQTLYAGFMFPDTRTGVPKAPSSARF
jgi:hypothetical protein